MLISLAIYLGTGLILSFTTLFVPFPTGVLLNNIGLYFFDPHTVLAMGGLYFLFGTSTRFFVFRKHLNFELFKDLVPGSLIGGLGVTYLLIYVPEKIIMGLLLSFAFLYVLKNLFTSPPTIIPKKTKVSGFIAGLSTGMLSSVGGPGGTLRGAYLTNHVKNMQEYHAVTAAVSLCAGIANTTLRYTTWDISWNFFFPFLLLIPIQLIIAIYGKKLLEHLAWKQKTFRFIVNAAVLASIVVIFPSLFDL